MAEDSNTETQLTRKKRKTRQSAFAVLVLSVVSGLGKLTYDVSQLANKNAEHSEDRTERVVKPSTDYIREICRGEIKAEVERLERQVEQTRKDFERSLDQVIKYYDRRNR